MKVRSSFCGGEKLCNFVPNRHWLLWVFEERDRGRNR